MAGAGKLCFLLLLAMLSLMNYQCVVECHADVFMVLLKAPPPLLHYQPAVPNQRLHTTSNVAQAYVASLVNSHDSLLQKYFAFGEYRKIYSYYYLLNGFAVSMSPEQAAMLARVPEVALVEKDVGVQKFTTYTPSFLELPRGAWGASGVDSAGEGIVIGIVDSGIDPTHPSFSNGSLSSTDPATSSNITQFQGDCDVGPEFPDGSCNGKIVAAQYFARAAIASGLFNESSYLASPFDVDGHGTHTASTAAGDQNVAVEVAGSYFGLASGMAPHAQLAIYRAIYPFGGFVADVIAAVDKAVEDGVDILSLSLGPSQVPSGLATFFFSFDLALLSAVKAGVFVTQAAGNSGPYPLSVESFSPWIFTVGSALHDRIYSNSLILGNNLTIQGLGLAPGTQGDDMYTMILASNAQKNPTIGQQVESRVNECQDAGNLDQELLEGAILVCMYTYNFVRGEASLKKVEETAQNLSVRGVVLTISATLDEGYFENGNVAPLYVPMIIIPTAKDSKNLLEYCSANSSTSTPSGRILGGIKATFSHEVPRVAYYSSRGPDPADSNYNSADVLKPNIIAPGSSIWAAWTSIGIDSEFFAGEKFAMLSGTSMATPHIAGIAALIKQKNPQLSPAGIASAIATTAAVTDKAGNPLLVQYPSSNLREVLGEATPFDFGSGLVNATAALDPGVIFDAGYEDYVDFLCTIPGASSYVERGLGYTCKNSSGLPTDLNTPYITIAHLNATRIIPRIVTSIAEEIETYNVSFSSPASVSVSVSPFSFTLASGQSQPLSITLQSTQVSNIPTFGSLLLSGSNGHSARLPIAVISASL